MKIILICQKHWIILLIVFFLSDLSASELRFSHLGLQQASVDVLAQDRYGFLWIGTKDGLIRYDGSVIKTYQNTPDDSTTLQSNTIIALHYDKQERLWVGTTSNGASYYDYTKNKFTRIDTNVIGKHAYRFFDDDKGQGVFVQTEKGLFFIDQKGETKLVLSTKHSESVLGVYSDPKGKHAILETGKRLTFGSSPQSPHETQLIPATISQYWQLQFCRHLIREPIKAGGGSGLFYCLQEGKVILSRLNETLKNADIDPAQLIAHDLVEDNDGAIWISSNLGLIRITGELITVIKSPGFDGQSLSSNKLSILLLGNKNTLFIGTQDQGLNILSLEKSGLRHFDAIRPALPKTHAKKSLPCTSVVKTDQPTIWSTLKDSDGGLWIGNDTGLSYRQKDSDAFLNHSRLGNTEQLIDLCAVSSLAETNGKIWIGTPTGLIVYDKRKQAAERFVSVGKTDDQHKLSKSFIRTLLYDGKRRSLWVGTDQEGLSRIDLDDLNVHHFPTATSSTSTLPNDQILSLYLDRDKQLWVGTSSGLSLWSEDSNNFRTITASDDPATLSDASVYTIYQPGKNNLWLGTGNGLNLFNIDQFKVEKRLYERDGLVNSTIYGLTPDNQGAYWITTANGLSRFDPAKKSFSNYYPQHDAQSAPFNLNAHKVKTGSIYLGGMGGLSIVNPQTFATDEQSYPPVLTQMDGLDSEGKQADLTQMLFPSKNRVIKAMPRDIRINFTHPFFGDSDLLKSQYRLLPATKNWSETYPGSHFVDFTDLKPGAYNFQLRANLASKQTSSFRFYIEPYFWETTWFRSLALAMMLLLTVFMSIYFYRTWSKFSAEKITRQHYRIVEHELRPHLHEANKHLEDLLQSPRLTTKDKQHIRYSIVPLVTKSIDFIAELRTLVDLRRTVKKPKQLYMLEDVLDEAMLFFKDSQNRIVIGEIEDINVLTHQDAVYLLVKNLISNAIKYSPDGEVVILNVYREQKSLCVECIDQGIGISKDNRKAIYEPYKRFTGEYKHINGQGIGLAIVRFIVHTYQGNIHIEDNQPKGTRFTVVLKGVVTDD